MLGKIYNFFERNQTLEEKKLRKEICGFLDPYLVLEQKFTLVSFSFLFTIYVFIYGFYSSYLYVFGVMMGGIILWPFLVMKVPNIRFRESSFKILAAVILTYSTCITGGVFSPIFAWSFFLSMDFMPHPYLVASNNRNHTGIISGLAMFAAIILLHYTGNMPASILPFDKQAAATILVLFGGFTRMIFLDYFNRIPVTTLYHKFRQNHDRNIELEKARDAAIELNRTKSVFLTQMSHELRTPLNAIIGFSEIMSTEMLGKLSPIYKEYAVDIHNSGTHLLSIVSKIMDMANLENGHYKLNIQELNPLDPILKVKDIYSQALEQKNMTMIVDCYIGKVRLRSDERAIIQMLSHVIGNAIEHCPEGSTIHTAIMEGEGGIFNFVISDNGKGFSQKVLNNFGMPFNIDVDPLHENSATTGLGLSIVKKIVTMLQGETRAENNIDGGATVIIALPHYQFESAAKQDQEAKKALSQ